MKKFYSILVCIFASVSGFATTWYSQGTGDPSVLSNWNSLSGGGGSTPANFTTSGDVFIMQTSMSGGTGTWTLGTGTTLQLNSVTFSVYFSYIYCYNLYITGSSYWQGEVYDYIYISGNFSMSGTSYMSNPPDWNYFYFNGPSTASSPQTCNISTTGTGSYSYIYVNSGAYVVLTGNSVWSQGDPMTVNTGGTLDLAGYTWGGNQGFTVSSGATLYTGMPGGLNAALTTSGTVTLNASGTYGFDGTSAQVTGTKLPASITSPGQIIVKNSSGVTLSQNTTVSTTPTSLVFMNGTLNTGSYSLTVPGVSTGVTGAGTSSYVVGNLLKTISGYTSLNYEVGDADYAPMQLTLSSAGTGGSLGVASTAGLHPFATSSGFGTSNMVNHYWTISNLSAAGPATVAVTGKYNLSDILGGSNNSFYTQQYVGGSWLPSALTSTNTSAPYTTSPMSPIALGSVAGDYIFGAQVPFVYASPVSLSYGIVAIGGSSVLSTTLAGGNLTAGPVTVTAPTNFKVSSSPTGPWSSTATFSYTPPSLGGTLVYIQFNPTATTTYSANVTVSGGGLAAAYNIAVTGIGQPACSGTPTAGTASAFPASGSGGTLFTLSLTGSTAAAGLTYQWQSSPNGSTWTNVYGATNNSYAFTGLTGNTYFQCIVSCGTFSATSSSTLITSTGAAASSCTPSSYYSPCTYYVGTSGNPVIINGISGSISDASTCGSGTGGSPYYYNNTSMSVTFVQGGSYSSTIGSGYYYTSGQIWIDFNDDGVFQQSETVGGYQNPTSTSTARKTPTITIPANAAPGTHRMRVMNGYTVYYAPGYSAYYPSYPQMNPCPNTTSTQYYMDTRDYTAVVNLAPAAVNTSVSSIAFGNVTTGGGSVPPQFVTLRGTNLFGGPLTVTPPANFSVSLDGITWSASPISVSYTPGYPVGSMSATNVYIQFNPSASTTYSGNITLSGAGLLSPVLVSVSGTGVSACSGTPSAGAAALTPSSGNGATVFSLSLSGASSTGGLIYQWQSSPNGTTWSNIQGGVYPTYTFSGLSANTQYRCIVTCVGSGLSSTSGTILATFTGGVATSSCTPTSSSSPCTYYVGTSGNPVIITGAAGTSISDASACGSGTGGSAYYYNNVASSVTFFAGGSYNATIGSGYYYNSGQIWIDFNDDGIFAQSETVGGYNQPVCCVIGPRYVSTITIPANATPGPHRMRAMNGYSSLYAPGYSTSYPAYPQMNPCPTTSVIYADTRDYTAVIAVPACSGTPNPGIVSVAGSAIGCNPYVTNIINVGENLLSGATYQWQSSTNPISGFTNIAGATNSVYSPTISTVGTVYYRQKVTCSVSGQSATSQPTQGIILNPLPAAISGSLGVCMGGSSTLSSVTSGGTWSSSNTAVATIGSSSGIVTPVATGTTTVSYTLPTGCFVTATVTVNPLPSAIAGATSVCQGATTTLTDAGGGTWTSSDITLATVGSGSGIVTGVTGGVPTITYTLSTGCQTTRPITVNATAPISGGLSLCTGFGTTLSNAIGGGTWSSSNTAVATIGSLSGVVSSFSAGTTTISYTNLAGCPVSASMVVISTPHTFTLSGGGNICPGSGAHIYVSGSDFGVGYQLMRSGSAVGSTVLGTGAALDMGSQTVSGIYTVIANPGSPCAVTMSGSPTITVLPAPTAFNVTGGGTYCSGGTGVHIGLNGSTAGFFYQLYNGSTAVGGPATGTGTLVDFGAFTAAGTYTVTATNNVTGCTGGMTGSALITVTPPPIAYAVTGGGGYCIGGAGVSIGLANSTAGVNYQLYNGGVASGSIVSGTGASLTFGLRTAAGTYTVVGTNTTTGCSGNMSGSQVVTVNALPASYSVTGGGAYCTGGSGVHIGLTSSATGVSYAVYLGGVATGITVSGTGAPLDLGSFTSPGLYTVVATNTATGCTNNMTGSATVSLNPLPIAYGLTGGGAYCQGGSGVHVGLSNSSLGVSYYLYRGGSVVGGGSGTTAPLDFGLETVPGIYTVLATIPGTGCSNVMAGSVTVVMNLSPNAYPLTGGGSFCVGGTGVPVGLANSDPTATYKLYDNGIYTGATLTGTGTAISFGTFTAPGIYTVVAADNTTACPNNMTGLANVIVNPLPVLHDVTGGGGYCSGGTGVHIGLNGSESSVSYQLQVGGSPSGSALSGTGGVLDFGLRTSAGTYTVAATNTLTGCSNTMAGSASVAINPLPAVYAVGGGGSYCAGGTGSVVTLTSSDAGINYQLYRLGAAVGGLVAGTGSAISFGAQTTAGTYTVVGFNASTACSGNMSGSAPVAITPAPTAFAVTGGGSYCAGGTGVHIGLGSSVTGVNYQLYNGAAAIGSAIPGNGLAIDFGALTTAGTYTVSGTTVSTGCSGNMTGSTAITINPLPAPLSVTGGGSYCSGTSGVHTGLATSVLGVSYQLYNGVAAMGAPVPGTGSPLDFGLQTIAGIYTVKGTATSTGCVAGMTGSATVGVDALPAAHMVTGGGNFCVGGSGVNVGMNMADGGVRYQLYLGASAIGSPLTGTGAALSFGLQSAPGAYTVQATDGTTGCVNNMSGTANVTVSATPVVYSVTGGGSYCPSGSGVTIGLAGSDPGMNYQLYNGSAVGAPVVGTGSAISFGLATVAGSYTVVATGSSPSCTAAMSGSASVVIGSVPVAYTVTGGGSYCAGGTGVNIGLGTGDAGVNYQLYLGSVATGSPVAGSGSALSFGSLTAPGTYTVKATDITSGCSNSMTGSASVAINGLPAAFSLTGGSYCAGGPGASVVLAGSEFGTLYQLYNGPIPVGSPLSGMGGVMNFGLQPGGVYHVIATNPATLCTSPMAGTATVAIDPLPTTYAMTGGGSYCSGGAGIDVQLSGSASGISYQLYNGTTAIGSPVAGTGSAIDFGLITSNGTYTVAATDLASGCGNTMSGSSVVATNPLPAVYAISGSSTAYCAGGTGVTVTLSGSDAGVNYQLYRDGVTSGGLFAGTGGVVSFGPQTLAGHYTVSAANASTGCSSTMAGSAAVAITSLPSAFAVGGGGHYCSGGTGVHVSLSGSSTGVQYQLYLASTAIGSQVPGTGSALDFGLQTGAGSYTVVATAPSTGCTNNMTGSASVGIDALPAAFAVTGGGSYCAGGAGVPVGISNSASGIRYQLYLGSSPVGGSVSGTGAPMSFGNQTAAGIYTIAATNSLTGCAATMPGTAPVVVNAGPVAYAVTGGGAYCSGGAGVHVGLHTSDSAISYQLYRGGSAEGSPVTGTGSLLDFGLRTTSGTYTVRATNSSTGCSSNMGGSATISTNALPAIYSVTGGGTYCAGGSGVHVGLGNSASGVSYILSHGSPVATMSGTGAPLDFGLQTAAGAYTVSAIIPATGCTSSMSGTASVVAAPAVVPSVSISSPGGNIGCTGRASHFSATATGGGTAPVYEWSVNGTMLGTASTFSYIPLSGDVVSVRMTSNATCASPATANAGMTMTVNTVEMPAVTITSDHGSEVCQGTGVTFTAIPVFGGATPVYTWLKNGVVDNSIVTASYSCVPSNGDIVSCILSSSYYCRLSDTASASQHLTVDVPQTPVVAVTSNFGSSAPAGAQVTFTATASNAGTAPAYQWYVNGIAVPGATLPVFTGSSFSNGDVITCDATTTGICSGVVGSGSLTLHVYGVGVPQVHALTGSITLSPNPNKGIFTIRGSLGISTDADVNVEITDMIGQVVYTSKVVARGGDINEEIHLSNALANGMYILSLRTDAGNKVFHIAVEQ